ncbi:hypothetical protein COU15_02370 [Candidatus Kaiserbacteria bacterium CG10_big_fil_rev_8_21_14_0_10_45_20]|uniref:WGR domain-containing protein n=1 Tax=Candidatus Kaiserbacteria bacterium CG10_big_fil_rev_8_21_14_0_10_45_20 TaxID=1974607 RepID=A0A2H0UFQ1_9BACT|nr:MAG: hypothetical protein COU15_02370 [Candidatus Kaiserbacteria bacterium CG10_big_fil_rev_8_21_14_0_10_45_20]
MKHSNPIKYYESSIDKNGDFRYYQVYKDGDKFVFECWDCREREDGGSVGTRKAYDEYEKVEDAVARFEEFLKAWE